MLNHTSVMLPEVVQFFADSQITIFFDGTVGAGGHAEGLLQAHPEITTYIACDKDEQNMELAKERLAPWASKILWIHGDFADLDLYLEKYKIPKVDGFFLI